MRIVFLIRMLVMFAMLRRPPQRPLLETGTTEESHHKLEPSTGLVGAMREVAVIARRQSEHPEVVEPDTKSNAQPRKGDEKGSQDPQMEQQKWTFISVTGEKSDWPKKNCAQ